MGAGIGVVEGLYERSPAKLRNGLIGGAIGGFLGGILFDPISHLMASSSSGMSSRATAFVILGMCIGILIGLVKVVFKDAWLTVLDGYRPGRQLILSDAETILGRAEYAALPFMSKNDSALELVHAKIVRQPNGRFVLEDNKSKEGTRLNNVRIDGPVVLSDGDVIRVGYNSIKFSERLRKAGEPAMAQAAAPARPAVQAPAPAPDPPAAGRGDHRQAVSRGYRSIEQTGSHSSRFPRHEAAGTAPKPVTAAPLAATASPRPAAPATVADGSLICPSCKKPVPKGQRYCIVCDMYF